MSMNHPTMSLLGIVVLVSYKPYNCRVSAITMVQLSMYGFRTLSRVPRIRSPSLGSLMSTGGWLLLPQVLGALVWIQDVFISCRNISNLLSVMACISVVLVLLAPIVWGDRGLYTSVRECVWVGGTMGE